LRLVKRNEDEKTVAGVALEFDEGQPLTNRPELIQLAFWDASINSPGPSASPALRASSSCGLWNRSSSAASV